MGGVVNRISRRLRFTVLPRGPDPTYADGDDASWMSVDWPAMTRRIEVGGQPVTIVDTGGEHKPVLLLLHGLSNRWQHWLLTIPALMETHRCIAQKQPSQPGTGDRPLVEADEPRTQPRNEPRHELATQLIDESGVSADGHVSVRQWRVTEARKVKKHFA